MAVFLLFLKRTAVLCSFQLGLHSDITLLWCGKCLFRSDYLNLLAAFCCFLKKGEVFSNIHSKHPGVLFVFLTPVSS